MNTIMIIGLMIILSSLWSLLLHETPILQRFNKAKSGWKLISLIMKAIQCKLCFSAHIFWITYLIYFGSFFGMILCPIPFFLTYFIETKILNITI